MIHEPKSPPHRRFLLPLCTVVSCVDPYVRPCVPRAITTVQMLAVYISTADTKRNISFRLPYCKRHQALNR